MLLLFMDKTHIEILNTYHDYGVDIYQFADVSVNSVCSRMDVARNPIYVLDFWLEKGYIFNEKNLLISIDYNNSEALRFLLNLGVRTDKLTGIYERKAESEVVKLMKEYDIPYVIIRNEELSSHNF
jgi:hypothetical protein